MKQLIIYLLLFSKLIFAKQEISIIQLLSYIDGVIIDKKQKSEIYEYQGGIIWDQKLSGIYQKQSELLDYMNYLWSLHRKDLKAQFFSEFSKDALAEVNKLGEQKLALEWQLLTSEREAILHHSFAIRDGILVNWQIGTHNRVIFLKKHKDRFQIASFHADDKDAEFHNRSLYFTLRPLEVLPAKVIKSFSLTDLKKELLLQINPNRPLVHIFKKKEKKWELAIMVKDNVLGSYRLDDQDHREGFIKLAFESQHFTSGQKEHQLLILQSNVPLKEAPKHLGLKTHLLVK